MQSFIARTALLLTLPIVGTLRGAGNDSSEPMKASQRPNIVLILIDDMGYGDIQPFGCTNCVTPNLDQMASKGLKLISFYYYLGYQLQAVRSGPWKLALKPQDYSANYKENAEHHGEHQPGLRLYNLVTDIGEQTNVVAQFPEVVQKLKALADHEEATLCGGPRRPGVRPPGYVATHQFLYPVTPAELKRAEELNAKMYKDLKH